MTAKQNLVFTSLLLLVLMGPCFGPMTRYLNSVMGLRPATGWQIVCFLVALGLVFGWTLRWMRRNGRTLADLGWGQPSKRGAILAGICVGLFWGGFGVMGFLRFEPEANLFEVSLLRLFTAVFGAGGAIIEDMVTRGLVMNELQRLKVSTRLQVVASSLLFALYHSIWLGSLPLVIGSFVMSLIYGLILAGLFVWGKRSLTPVILAHSLSLLVGEPFLTMQFMAAMRGL